ncbi:MAG: LuxR C-terminal-related transcriptional regulator [Phycisphaera sp.]|nr:MAG: LuxR C-terminal-related transcriptional regulator [Phycisphaera sp.]
MAERPSNTPPPGSSGQHGPSDPGSGGVPWQTARPAARPLDRPAASSVQTEPKPSSNPLDRHPIAALIGLLEHEPALGLAIVDGQGRTLKSNHRFTALTVPPGSAEGATASDRPSSGSHKATSTARKGVWARVGAEAVRTAAAERHPTVLHFIHEGRQVQCDVWPLPIDAGLEPRFLVLAVEGRFDPTGTRSETTRSEERPGASTVTAAQRFTTFAPMLAELGALSALTARELEVLALIGQGMATREIAESLGRSPRTVERHCDAIHKKLNTSNRVQMARYAMRAGLTAEAGKLKRV